MKLRSENQGILTSCVFLGLTGRALGNKLGNPTCRCVYKNEIIFSPLPTIGRKIVVLFIFTWLSMSVNAWHNHDQSTVLKTTLASRRSTHLPGGRLLAILGIIFMELPPCCLEPAPRVHICAWQIEAQVSWTFLVLNFFTSRIKK